MYCACGSGRNGAKVDLPANAHAVPEIPVGSRETDFSFPEHAHVVPEAGAAPGRPYRATRFEDIGKHPGPDRLFKDRCQGRDHKGTHGHFIPLYQPGKPGEIGVPPVRAGPDKNLVERRTCKGIHGLYRVHPVRNGNQRNDIGKIQIEFLSVRTGFIFLTGSILAVFFEVADRYIVCIEEPGFCPGFDREVGEDKPFVHCEGMYPVADKLERLIRCAVSTELTT